MALELVYTSAPKGLRQGSSGYCTVACTRGMPPNYVELLESLSGYKPVFAAGDAMAAKNPISCSHYRVYVGGKGMSVLSRICFAGFDHTGRTNKLAHHLLVDSEEQVAAGPFALAGDEGLFLSQWAGEPRQFDAPKRLPSTPSPSGPARLWGNLTGDAGWAGVLAASFDGPASKPTWLVFEPGMDVIGLLREAGALLPPEMRWQVTFNTYLTSLPASTTCHWRCVLDDSPLLKEAQRTRAGLVIDLRLGRGLGRAPADGVLVETARTGRSLPAARVAPGPPPSISPRSPRAPSPPVTPLRFPPPEAEANPAPAARAGRLVAVLAGLLVVSAAVAVVQTARLSDEGTRSARLTRDLDEARSDLDAAKAHAAGRETEATRLQEEEQAARGALGDVRRELLAQSESLKGTRAKITELEQNVRKLQDDLAVARAATTTPPEAPVDPAAPDPPSPPSPQEKPPSKIWVFRMDGLRNERVEIPGVTVGMSIDLKNSGRCELRDGWQVWGPDANGRGLIWYATLKLVQDAITLRYEGSETGRKRDFLRKEIQFIDVLDRSTTTIQCILRPLDDPNVVTLEWAPATPVLVFPRPLPWLGGGVIDKLECTPAPVNGVRLVADDELLPKGELRFRVDAEGTTLETLAKYQTLHKLEMLKEDLTAKWKSLDEGGVKKLIEDAKLVAPERANELLTAVEDVCTRWKKAVELASGSLTDGLPKMPTEAELFAPLQDLLKNPPKDRSDKSKRKTWKGDVDSNVDRVAKSLREQVNSLLTALQKEITFLETFKKEIEKPQTIVVTVDGKPVYTCKIALKLD